MDVKKEITAFLEFVGTINEQYVSAQNSLEEAEKTEMDGLHYLEFAENVTPNELANAARKLQLARRQRREAKDTVYTAKMFVQWCDTFRVAIDELGKVCETECVTDIPIEERHYTPRTNNFTGELASTGKLPPPKPVIWIDKHGNESYFKSIASAARSLDIDRNDILACCRYEREEVDGQRFRFYSDSLNERYKPEEEQPQETEPEAKPKKNTSARAVRLTSADGDALEYPSVKQAMDDLAIPSKSALYRALKNGTEYNGFRWEYIT